MRSGRRRPGELRCQLQRGRRRGGDLLEAAGPGSGADGRSWGPKREGGRYSSRRCPSRKVAGERSWGKEET